MAPSSISPLYRRACERAFSSCALSRAKLASACFSAAMVWATTASVCSSCAVSRAKLASVCRSVASSGRWSSVKSRSPFLTACPSEKWMRATSPSSWLLSVTLAYACTVPMARIWTGTGLLTAVSMVTGTPSRPAEPLA